MANQSQKGNEENMAKVREAMQKAQGAKTTADQVQLGSDLETGITIDYTAESGKVYQGTVVFKRPSAKDLMKIGALKSEYFREAGVKDIRLVDESIRLLAHVLAYLKVTIVKSPEWLLNVDKVVDTDVLYEVYAEYKKWENSFRQPLS